MCQFQEGRAQSCKQFHFVTLPTVISYLRITGLLAVVSLWLLSYHFASFDNYILTFSNFGLPGQHIWMSIQEQYSKRGSSSTLQDIIDGEKYLEHCRPGGILHNKNNISVLLNSDGIPIFRSSGIGVWPVQLVINEIPPKERYISLMQYVYVFIGLFPKVCFCKSLKTLKNCGTINSFWKTTKRADTNIVISVLIQKRIQM